MTASSKVDEVTETSTVSACVDLLAFCRPPNPPLPYSDSYQNLDIQGIQSIQGIQVAG